MRVLYVIDSLTPGGAETSLALMAPGLVRGGIDLRVSYLHERVGLREILAEAGIRTYSIDSKTALSRVGRLRKLIQSFRPDIIHTTLTEADIVGRLAGRLERVPVVSSLVNILYGPEHRDDPLVSRWKLGCWQLADIATAHFARRFHAVGVDVANVMSRRLRVSPALVDVVPRGRDAGALGVPSDGRRMLARQRLGVVGSEVILAVGRHVHQKGFDLLLDAFAGLVAARPSAQLLIAGGEGPKTPALKAQIDALHLASRVRLLGHRTDISDVFLAANLFAFPSRREGSPGALLEAMALAVPSIASDIPAIREVAGRPPVVRLVQPDSPSTLLAEITHQLDHPENAKAMGIRARDRFLRCYTLETAVKGMLKFYERAAGPQP